MQVASWAAQSGVQLVAKLKITYMFDYHVNVYHVKCIDYTFIQT